MNEKSNEPLYKILANEVERWIKDNNLPVGTRLPSLRVLVEKFKCSMCTAYNALEELKYKGYVESKDRSGYFVSYDGWNTLFPNSPDWDKYISMGWLRARGGESRIFNRKNELSLSGYGLGKHFKAEDYFKKAMERCLTDTVSFSDIDGDYRGSFSVRETICRHMSRYDVRSEPDNILITSGVHNSLSLIRFAFMHPGMDFLCDSCFTTKINTSYSSLGINKVHLPLDNEGIMLETLTQSLQKNKQSVVCSLFGGISAYADDKTFGVSSIFRKKAILKLCNTARTPIIEVDMFRDLLPKQSPLPLKSLDDTNSVLYLSSFSKSFMHRFRFGWIIGPKKVVAKLADLRMQLEGRQNSLFQKIAEELIRSGLYYEFLDDAHEVMAEYTPKIIAILEKYLTDIAEWNINSMTRVLYIRFFDNIDICKMYENKGELDFTAGYTHDAQFEKYIGISPFMLPLDEFEKAVAQLAILAKNSLR